MISLNILLVIKEEFVFIIVIILINLCLLKPIQWIKNMK